ncbi:CaiB/BaiF CoA transferase family protein [Rothia uropygialis]|uniref:CaiB/BaiF CoA transferase family protein n=1 Tax=Kocuria sp. 36 TaxID=1415402 RepID=UPI00101CA759|nr:CoA transferase [Kocuria sp. 36]
MSCEGETVEKQFSNNSNNTNLGPLSGVRVIDMATVVMGPYAAQILGDLGADVIKIESPRDSARNGLYARTPGMGPLHLNVNRNKRSINLDLKSEDGHEAAMGLLKSADILITNMRISALSRLGLDYEAIKDAVPHLVYVHAQGFRSDSDRANLAAYDETIQAASGILDVSNRADDIQKPVILPTIIADKVSGLTMVYSALAALYNRNNGGPGQLVEVPMADTMIAFTLVEHLQGKSFDPALSDTGFPLSLNKGHYARTTRDGRLAVVLPYTGQNFKDVFAAAGRDDWATDPLLDETPFSPREHGQLMNSRLDECISALSLEEWSAVCSENNVPFGPVLNLDDAAEDEYVRSGHLLDAAEHPTEGPTKVVGIPMRFSETPASVRRLAPVQGADTEAVLAELSQQTATLHTVDITSEGSEVA